MDAEIDAQSAEKLQNLGGERVMRSSCVLIDTIS